MEFCLSFRSVDSLTFSKVFATFVPINTEIRYEGTFSVAGFSKT